MPINEYGIEYRPVSPAIAPTAPGVSEEESGFFGEMGKGIVRGFLNVGSGLVGTAEYVVPGQQESWLRAKENIQSAASKFPFEDNSWEGWAGRVIGEAFPYMGTALVAGYAGAGIAGGIAGAGTAGLTGGAAALGAGIGAKAGLTGAAIGAATIGFSVEGQNAYDEAKSRGASENEANAERLIVGTVNAAIESLQITRLMKFHSEGALSLGQFIRNVRGKAWDLVQGDAKKFTGQVLRTALEEALEESVQEGVSISVPGFLRGDYPKNEDGTINWGEVVQRIGLAGLGGGVAGGVLGGAGALVGAAHEIGKPSVSDIDSTIEKIKGYDLTDAEKDQWISQLEQLKGSFREPVSQPAPPAAEQQVNIYKTVSGSRTGITEQEVIREGDRYIDSVTKEDVILDTKASGTGIAKPTKPEKWYHGGPKGLEDNLVEGWVTKDREEALIFAKRFSDGGEVYEIDSKDIVVAEPGLKDNNGVPITNYQDYGFIKGIKPGQPGVGIISKLDIKIPGFSKEYDEQLVNAVSQLNLELRTEHTTKIKKERGINFNQALGRLEQEKIDNSVKAMAVQALVKSEMMGELGLRFESLKFNEDQINYYYQRVNISPESKDITVYLPATSGLNKLFGLEKGKEGSARLPEPNEIEALEKIFGAKLAEVLTKARTISKTGKPKTWWSVAKDLLNFPRALIVSGDMSMAGRQSLLLLPMSPKNWLKAVYMGYRAYLSPEYSKFSELQIKSHPMYPMWKRHKGHFSTEGGLTSGEEYWSSNLARHVIGVKASERGATTLLNAVRFYTSVKFYEAWAGTGATSEDYDLLTQFVNHASGRGDIKGLENHIPALNIGFFAPRYTLSKPQAIADLFKGVTGDIKKRHFSVARKVIAYDLVKMFTSGMAVLFLLSLIKGVTVEKDPRSSDFGKIRFGNTRIDFWGGYSQIARLLAQMVVAESKGVDSGHIMKAERGTIIWRYVKTKLSPAAGFAVDVVSGETFLGEKLEASPEAISKQIYDRFTPLFMQDTIEAFRYQGLLSGSIVAPLTFHGIGAMTYPKKAGSEAIRLRDSVAKETFGVGWDELGPTGQKALRTSRPEIELSERQARIERENFDMTAKRIEEQQRAMKNIVKGLPTIVRNEIESSNVYLPGLSRYVANGWYLNDKRHTDYQKQVKASLSLYLTKLVNVPAFNRLPPEMKALLIEDVTNSVKTLVRDKLVSEATIEDFQHIRGK